MNRRHCSAVSLAAIALMSGSCHAVLDFDHNGTVNLDDYFAFQNAYVAGSPNADLNGDGVLDATDYSLFMDETNAPDYRYYLAVANSCTTQMDVQTDLTDLHIHRGVVAIGEWAFNDENQPVIYLVDNGYHLLLRNLGSNTPPNYAYSNWNTNYQTRMGSHRSTIASTLAAMMPCGVSACDFDGIIYLDYESVYASWLSTNQWDSAQLTKWHNCVRAINLSAWDTTFLATVGFAPPTGTSKYDDLNATQQAQLDKLSWQYFAQDFWIQAIDECRNTCPKARVGVYGYPIIGFVEIVNVGTMNIGPMNDELEWLYSAVDLFLPELYAPTVINDESLSCQPCQSKSECMTGANDDRRAQMVTWLQLGLDEAKRVRTAYNASAKILPFITWHYSSAAGPCHDWSLTISDTNLRMMLYQPWVYGADGAIIWGWFQPCSNNCQTISKCPYSECTATGSVNTPTGLRTELLNRWQGLINDLAVPWP